MDVSKLCRSCMKEVASWERENFDPKAVEMFCFCTSIMITEEDKLPKQFCYDCIIKIESAYTYITETQIVDVTLKNIISRNNTSVIVEPDAQTKPIATEPIETMKLTLPDYKISTTADNLEDHNIFDSVNEENANEERTCKNVQTNISTQIERKRGSSIKQCAKVIENVGEVKKIICAVCRKGFNSKVWFAKHMEKEHNGHKYTCAQCPKTFSKPSQLSYHAASHSEERKFACNACGKRFKRRKQLSTHARSHVDVRPYACDKCSMRFKVKSILKCHMKVHEEEKQYLCSFCGWSFAQAGNLEVHTRTHTGEKPFRCSECEFSAAAASNLRRHQRRHRAQRSHVCNRCRKGFYDASALARHTRTHTGELPYKCPGCSRAFADSWKRKTHLMRAHTVPLQHIPRMRRDGGTLLPTRTRN